MATIGLIERTLNSNALMHQEKKEKMHKRMKDDQEGNQSLVSKINKTNAQTNLSDKEMANRISIQKQHSDATSLTGSSAGKY